MIDEMKIDLPELPEIENRWVPIVKKGRDVPFGYVQDSEDASILIPVPLELELLEEAKKHLKQYSYRSVAAWLSETSGRSISHMGLRNRVLSDRRNKKKAQGYYNEAKRLEELIEKIRKLETQTPGATSTRSRADEFDSGPSEA